MQILIFPTLATNPLRTPTASRYNHFVTKVGEIPVILPLALLRFQLHFSSFSLRSLCLKNAVLIRNFWSTMLAHNYKSPFTCCLFWDIISPLQTTMYTCPSALSSDKARYTLIPVVPSTYFQTSTDHCFYLPLSPKRP